MSQDAFEFVKNNMAETPFHQWLLPELFEVDADKGIIKIRLPIRQEFGRLPGRPELHGGVVAALFLPPTLIASIYGMNFKMMPELEWAHGYPMALLMMLAAAIVPYWIFKWKKWL